MKTPIALTLAFTGFFLMIEGFGSGLPPEIPRTYDSYDHQHIEVPLNAGHGFVGLLLLSGATIIAVTTPRKHEP